MRPREFSRLRNRSALTPSVGVWKSCVDAMEIVWRAASDGDDDLSAGVALLHVPDGVGCLAQRVRPVDDRRHLAGLDELVEPEQGGCVLRDYDRGQSLRDEPRDYGCPQAAVESAEPPAAGLAPDDDQRPAAGEGGGKLAEGGGPHDVVHHVA